MAATVALSAYWPWLWSRAFGSITALAVIGKQGGPATDTFVHDFPHGFRFAGLGHDGRYFYTIARHPFDYTLLRQRIPITSYRYRRILYPFLAGRLAPHGGTALLLAFVFVSLVGVGIGAWAMTRFPRAPRWLPLIVAADPGVAVALCFTLGDALATGLALAAFAVMFRRRWAVATLLVVLACLTRETSLLAALCLATWPGIPRRARVTLAVVPCATYAAWAVLVAHLTRSSVFAAPEGGLFTFPLGGWAHGTHARLDLLDPPGARRGPRGGARQPAPGTAARAPLHRCHHGHADLFDASHHGPVDRLEPRGRGGPPPGRVGAGPALPIPRRRRGPGPCGARVGHRAGRADPGLRPRRADGGSGARPGPRRVVGRRPRAQA